MASELGKGQKFCTQCGIRLVMGIVRVWYHRETGEPLYHVRGCCPNKRHWWDGHDKGRVDSWGPVLMSYDMAMKYLEE